MADTIVVTSSSISNLPRIAEGKVRDLYAVDDKTLLFVATDRISAYDVIMKNGIPSKGRLLTLLSAHWFSILPGLVPGLRTHFLSLSLPASVPAMEASPLRLRSMQVRRLRVFPIEAIVRGYITGSAWKEYRAHGTVHGIRLAPGLREAEAFPDGPLYTPSTKAAAGAHDENIHPSAAAALVGGDAYAARIERLALDVYGAARTYAAARGVIIADTKFEFALDEETDEVVLVDEVLTPDSSRFWPASAYEVGRDQESFDKQFLRNWLTREGLKTKEGVEMPQEVLRRTGEKYVEAFEALTGKRWAEVNVEGAEESVA